VALAIALGASLFWGEELHRKLDREQASAAVGRQAIADLEGRLEAAKTARLAAEARLRDQIALNISRMFPESRSVSASPRVDRFNAATDRDPQWAPFYRRLQRRRVLAQFGILLTALKVPADKIGPLEDLLVDRAMATRILVHKLREQGRDFKSAEVTTAVGGATDEIDGRIEKLVGSDNARKLREWNSAVYYYGNVPNGRVAQDAVTLREAGFEVDADQMVRLALIRYEVYALNPEAASGSRRDPVDPGTGLTTLESQLFARQAEVLTPAEIAVLRDWAVKEHRARTALDALRAAYHLEPGRTSP
jgi:hypothetical protein